MKNKKAAITVTAFITVFLIFVIILGVSEHIPFLGKALSLIIAVILIIFVLAFTVFVGRRKK